jgi:hypothetical protein
MNTQVITRQAVYEPNKSKITYFADGKPLNGFVGNTAFKKFIQAMADPTIEVIIKDNTDMEKSQLIKQMHAILAKKGLMDIKHDIVSQYGVESSKDLTIAQLNEIIGNLQKQEVRPEVRKERSLVLTLLDKLGIKGNKEIGWDHVNNFLKHPRIAGKTLYEMNLQELTDTCKKLRMIQSKKTV